MSKEFLEAAARLRERLAADGIELHACTVCRGLDDHAHDHSADSLAAVVVPDDPTSTELALVEQLTLADAAAAAALESMRELVQLLDQLGGYRSVTSSAAIEACRSKTPCLGRSCCSTSTAWSGE